ncbi:hypothetical protein LXL04_004918 [Taraxacum kok-saghyz]
MLTADVSMFNMRCLLTASSSFHTICFKRHDRFFLEGYFPILTKFICVRISSRSLFIVTPVTVIALPTIIPATGIMYCGVNGKTFNKTNSNIERMKYHEEISNNDPDDVVLIENETKNKADDGELNESSNDGMLVQTRTIIEIENGGTNINRPAKQKAPIKKVTPL